MKLIDDGGMVVLPDDQVCILEIPCLDRSDLNICKTRCDLRGIAHTFRESAWRGNGHIHGVTTDEVITVRIGSFPANEPERDV